MKMPTRNICIVITILLNFLFWETQEVEAQQTQISTCTNRKSKCFLKPLRCPRECPSTRPRDRKAKVCYVNCDSPLCLAECKYRKPNCNGNGAACFGADGSVFYFHGKSNEYFTLVTDHNLHIKARFIGHRPASRSRDYTWIQALGIMYGHHTLSIQASKAESWDDNIDHLEFSYDGEEITLPEIALLFWNSPENEATIERISRTNSVLVSIKDVLEIAIRVVPVTKEDDRVHNYQIPSNDCFAHLEVQFRFFGLSSQVEGVLGRTYQPDFVNQARPGIWRRHASGGRGR
ncbi:hypothetical protein Leryth_011711 [Lithospermum erythrorhizon]|nr:hypothetical protein Leryth_011711 [Lithospermum erythrorhizon]